MSERAVSEVVGFALVFSMIVAMVAIVTLGGMGQLQSARDFEQANNAERAFEVLADNLADVHQRGAPSRATEIDLEHAQLFVGDPVTINVSGEDTSGAAPIQISSRSTRRSHSSTERPTERDSSTKPARSFGCRTMPVRSSSPHRSYSAPTGPRFRYSCIVARRGEASAARRSSSERDTTRPCFGRPTRRVTGTCSGTTSRHRGIDSGTTR
ncbi:hypothetical protein VB779_07480 [Haloarculaceae archaeon H-GB11]|nr:hypothetical protein [Haloarculaceae archaeon H-GB11]